jgi:transcriptional regulator of acetoin/glycerol metabolism
MEKQSIIREMRQAFFSGEEVSAASSVRSDIVDSWRRSRLHGLDPHAVRPAPSRDAQSSQQLLQAARPLIELRTDWLAELPSALTLTNTSGRLLDRWVQDRRFTKRLDSRAIVPGIGLAESDVGTTSSGVALETGKSVIVTGYEHFSDDAVELTSAGSAIRHPVTRRILGSLNLSCELENTSPLMLQMVRQLVELLELQLLEQQSAHERVLLDSYLQGRRDSRRPVLYMNADTLIGNAAAARLMGSIDPTILWDQASRAIHSNSQQTVAVPRTDDQEPIGIQCRPIVTGAETVGAVVSFTTPPRPRSPQRAGTRVSGSTPPRVLPGLAGRSVAWQAFRGQLSEALTSDVPLLLVGEPGVGKTAVLDAVAAGSEVSRIAARGLEDPAETWPSLVRSGLASAADVLVLDDLHHVPEPALLRVLGLLSAAPQGAPRILAAYTRDVVDQFEDGNSSVLMAWPGATVSVPPVRDRLGDVPVLVEALTNAKSSAWNRPVWAPDAMQTLNRVTWPLNVLSIDRLVATMLRRRTGPQIHRADLPTDILAMATRRELTGMERMEAQAITAAIHLAEGNKKLAADHLGVARSTLYRKMRALGLDLEGTIY